MEKASIQKVNYIRIDESLTSKIAVSQYEQALIVRKKEIEKSIVDLNKQEYDNEKFIQKEKSETFESQTYLNRLMLEKTFQTMSFEDSVKSKAYDGKINWKNFNVKSEATADGLDLNADYTKYGISGLIEFEICIDNTIKDTICSFRQTVDATPALIDAAKKTADIEKTIIESKALLLLIKQELTSMDRIQRQADASIATKILSETEEGRELVSEMHNVFHNSELLTKTVPQLSAGS